MLLWLIGRVGIGKVEGMLSVWEFKIFYYVLSFRFVLYYGNTGGCGKLLGSGCSANGLEVSCSYWRG